jgi:tol-pal system protein YbgF
VLGTKPPRAFPRQASLGHGLPARRSPALLLAPLLFLVGCSGVAEVTGTATQDDVIQLRSDLSTLQLQVQRSKTDADALASRLEQRQREQQSESERQTTAINRRVEALASALAGLTARMDEMNARLETLTRQARAAPSPGPAPTTARPVQPVTPNATASATPGPATAAPVTVTPGPGTSAPGPATAAPTPTTRPATGPPQPKDIYQASYIDFSKGSYALAIAGFREFVRRFPDDDLADDAQYWIGESYFSLARSYGNANQPEKATQALEQAVQEFKKVVANYPRGDKTPTALYKEALALIELKQADLARSRLQYLVDNFPQAAETPLARERLTSLKER